MAVPGTGEISLGKIRQELQAANYTSGPYTAAATGLDPAENGTYATINTCSPSYPLSANPAKMSEWRNYDHDAPCYASLYALDDGNTSNTGTQSYLYSNGNYVQNAIGTGAFNINGKFAVNFWVKHHPTSTFEAQGYILGIYDSGFSMLISWWGLDYSDCGLPNRPALSFGISQGESANPNTSAGYVSAVAILNDTTATPNNQNFITEVGNGKSWGGWGSYNSGSCALGAQTGSVNDRGYTMISVIYDAESYGTDDWVKMYWNGQQLYMPYQSVGFATSSIEGDLSNRTAEWTDGEFNIGGFYPGELSCGLYLDEVSLWPYDPLDDTDIGTLWNNGDPITVNDMTGSLSSTDFLHYSFEEGGNLGQDLGAGGYNYSLADYNTPTQTSDHA